MDVTTAANSTDKTPRPASGDRPNPGQSHARAWKPLRLLTFYRLVLTGLLTVLYFLLRDVNPFNVSLPQLFAGTLLAYLGFSLVVGFTTRLHWPGFRLQTLVQVFTDIAAITLLMHASGGLNSGLSVLMVVAVAAGALLLPGRLAFLFAASATLVLLAEASFGQLTLARPSAGMITRAGLLGMVLFAAAGLAYILAVRVRESESLAKQRGIDLANLQQLNQHIIQHLQSGVLVIDPDGAIRMCNSTAKKLLGLNPGPHSLEATRPDLHRQLHLWQQDHSWQPETITESDEQNRLIPRFSELRTAQGTGTLVFLDDSATLARQSQQIRLASLGRLSASIAHEIRNPLGAISHAAQLLEESERLDAADKRLIEIIGTHSQRVNTIIENVLQLSRRKTVQLQTIALHPWLQDFVADFCTSEKISPEQIRLSGNKQPVQVQMDPDHLHQVVWNLCRNAVRHAGAGAEITLRLQSNADQLVSLDIMDNGAGVPADKVEQIFEPFFTTESSGTGLGLYLARELCELNRCHLAYLTNPNGGSCFRIHFAPSLSATRTPAVTPRRQTEHALA